MPLVVLPAEQQRAGSDRRAGGPAHDGLALFADPLGVSVFDGCSIRPQGEDFHTRPGRGDKAYSSHRSGCCPRAPDQGEEIDLLR